MYYLFLSKISYSRFIYLVSSWFKKQRDSGRPYCWLCLCVVQSHCIFPCSFSLNISLWLMAPSSLHLKNDILVEMVVWTYRARPGGKNGIKHFFEYFCCSFFCLPFFSLSCLWYGSYLFYLCFIFQYCSQRCFCEKSFFFFFTNIHLAVVLLHPSILWVIFFQNSSSSQLRHLEIHWSHLFSSRSLSS